GAEAEVAQILRGLSRTSARIWVVDRDLNVLARAGSLRQPRAPPEPDPGGIGAMWSQVERTALHPLYVLMLGEPDEAFTDADAARSLSDARDVQSALAGIPASAHYTTRNGRVQILTAAHPIWVGDEVRGAVLVEATTNRVLDERNRA